jgi:hypothetical protein
MSLKAFLQRLPVNRKTAEQIQSPILVQALRHPYGAFKFKAEVPKGISCAIEASTNLNNWMILAEQDSSGEIDYVDSHAPNFSHRFYRLSAGGILSRNIIGYASVSVPPGFSMIANPFESTANNVAELFKGMPDGTSLSKFDTRVSALSENKIKFGKWTNPMDKLVPGEGGLFFNPTQDYKTLDFFGDLKLGRFSVPIPAGFSMRSSLRPLPGRLHTDLGFPATEGDVIHLFDRDSQKYVLYPFVAATWAANPPVVSVGESFWVAKKTAKNWTQNVMAE